MESGNETMWKIWCNTDMMYDIFDTNNTTKTHIRGSSEIIWITGLRLVINLYVAHCSPVFNRT